MFALSLVWSGCLFALEEGVLGQANRRAEAIRHEIRSGSPPPSGLLNRRWIAGAGTTLYHSRYVDHERDAIDGLSVYELEDGPWRIHRRTYAARATFTDEWEGQDVWTRRFPGSRAEGGAPIYTPAALQALPFVDPPATFRTEQPDPDVMGFRELDRYIETLRARGLDVVSLVVALHRKASFPFVCFVLTLIAVPFAVTTGSRGALYGVGAGIVLAFSYWVILSIFGAIGSAGLLAPALAAWAPNVLFSGTATYFLLTART
jgi:lipopolysaccharide export system permease protein